MIELDSISKVICDGTKSCHSAKIRHVSNIIATGEDSLSNSMIVSDGIDSTISIDGDISDIFYVYCNSSDTCKIDCQSNDACTFMYLYCLGSFGKCYVDCDLDAGIGCPLGSGFFEWTVTDTTPSVNEMTSTTSSSEPKTTDSSTLGMDTSSTYTTENAMNLNTNPTLARDIGISSTIMNQETEPNNNNEGNTNEDNSDTLSQSTIVVLILCVTLVVVVLMGLIVFVIKTKTNGNQFNGEHVKIDDNSNGKIKQKTQSQQGLEMTANVDVNEQPPMQVKKSSDGVGAYQSVGV